MNDINGGVLMNHLLSIVVPIKDNYECLKSILVTLKDEKLSSVELVIQDNTIDNIEIFELLKKEVNKNIKYFHHKSLISMSENFNNGILNSSGKYILIIGADDNISTKIYQVVEYLEKNQIDSAIFRKAMYNWPGMKFRVHKNFPNLIIPKTKKNIKKICLECEFRKLLKKGMVSVGKLPEPYHGIVKRESLMKVYELTGTFVPGSSPDMAMAVTLSYVVKSHIFIDLPFVISGHSYNSAGGKGARGEHKGDLKDKTFLPKNVEENWPAKIPKLWTGPTIYADSLFNSLIKIKEDEKLKEFNYFANYAYIIAFFPEYKKIVSTYFKINLVNILRLNFYLLLIFSNRLKVFIFNTIISNFKFNSKYIHRNVTNSYEASKLVDIYINDKFEKIYKKN